MTDNAEKERYPGHGNNADRQDDSKLRFILRYDQTLMTFRNVFSNGDHNGSLKAGLDSKSQCFGGTGFCYFVSDPF